MCGRSPAGAAHSSGNFGTLATLSLLSRAVGTSLKQNKNSVKRYFPEE
jgi:hypothetical protein